MMLLNDFPSLETDRLLLRPLADQDLEFVYRHFSDPEVTRYLLDEEPVRTLQQAREIIDFYAEPSSKSYNRWIILRKSDELPIGTCGYHKWAKRHFRAEIGYDLSPAAWGQGYMHEALRAALRHGIEGMGLNRIDALVYTENDRSIRLLQKLGFQNEGLLRDYFYLNGKFYDHYLYSLLRSELP